MLTAARVSQLARERANQARWMIDHYEAQLRRNVGRRTCQGSALRTLKQRSTGISNPPTVGLIRKRAISP
jgi:hypothetical protein